MNIKTMLKTALVLVLCAALLAGSTLPGFAAQKITNPGSFCGTDGIDADPEVGIHNSYAWCTEMFRQTDADYLWVGTNRDMGRSLLGAAGDVGGGMLAMIAGLLGDTSGLPEVSEDKAGKIYRQRAADNDAPWELMYENPAINGYRRMILFKGYLYVCAGLTNTPEYDYSIVLRFAPDFKPGDQPQIVLWENVLREEDGSLAPLGEYFRAACVYEDRLYIGTFDSKIYVTDGTGLANLMPNEGPKSTGWELYADLMLHPDFNTEITLPIVIKNTTYIWDMVGYKGSLYAVVTYMDGFNMYKLTPQTSGGPEIIQVVGNAETAKYPNGMGMRGLVSASPYVMTFEGKEYVYVSTFANGPFLLANFARGNLTNAFDISFSPPAMFRFTEDDNWEVVVGDTTGRFVAKDKTGAALPVIGNQRAGFSTWSDLLTNRSFNQYIWWMTQYDGKLYATTWDLGVFKRNVVAAVILGYLGAFMGSPLGQLLMEGGELNLQSGLAILGGIPGAIGALLSLIPVMVPATVYNERTNPGGFDLFVSEDGKNFSPVTVNGFDNRENYGGRVLLPTEYGLFACTANPFGGAQVWRLDDMKQELQVNIPAEIHLAVGETFKGSVRGLDMPKDAVVQMEAASDYAQISLAKRSSGTIIDRTSRITNLLGQYIEIPCYKKYPTQMYDIVFTGTAAGTQDVTLRFSWNGIEASKAVRVVVTG